MKSQSVSFIANEEGSKRKPAELYHMWYGNQHWRFNSGDVDIVYDGKTYTAAYLERSAVSYDMELDSNVVTVTVTKVTTPVVDFMISIPTDLIWISIHKFHRNGPLDETSPVFMGQIQSVKFKGLAAIISCSGFDHYLNQIVPRYRYGIKCQHTLFDPNTCGRDGLLESDFTITTQLSGLDSTGLILTAASFGNQADDYYTLGKVTFGNYKVMITDHTGTSITIRYKISSLRSDSIVAVTAGCNGTRYCCHTKFNNLNNCLNFEDIPRDNPATWISG